MMNAVLDSIRSLSWSNVNMRGAAYTIVATVALIVALKLLSRFVRSLRERLGARIEERRAALRVQQWEMVSAEQVQFSGKHLLRFLHALVAILLIDFYVTLVLRFFPATEPLSERYFEFVMAPVVAVHRAFVAYVPDLVYIVVVSALVFFFLRFLHLFFRATATGALKVPGFYADWAEPTYKLIRALFLAFLLIAIFPRLPGSDDQAFRVVSLFIGALLTLGSTAAVGNAVAGVVLVYTRAFQVGDWIRVGGTTGQVTRRTLLATRLRNALNEQVTIPNGEVLREHVVNCTPAARKGRLGLTVSVAIGYDVDWRTVEELLLSSAKATPDISSSPPPTVLQISFDDFSVNYTLRAFTGGVRVVVRTALARNILDEFNRAGVEILTPDVAELRKGGKPVIPDIDDLGKGDRDT